MSMSHEEPKSSPLVLELSLRCSVRGCVFPVSRRGRRKCQYHALQQLEASLFESRQPSCLLLLQAPFGLPDEEPDDSRQKDRVRWASEREQFLLDDAA